MRAETRGVQYSKRDTTFFVKGWERGKKHYVYEFFRRTIQHDIFFYEIKTSAETICKILTQGYIQIDNKPNLQLGDYLSFVCIVW